MAFNPSPSVAVARDAARKLGDADQVVVIAISRRRGTMQVVTYGRDRRLCDDAKTLGDVAYEAVMGELKTRAGEA